MVPVGIRRATRQLLVRFLAWRWVRKSVAKWYSAVWSAPINSIRGISTTEKRAFATQLASWKPVGKPEAIALRWAVTSRCPYSCSYCYVVRQQRTSQLSNRSNHAFHNYSVPVWLEAFRSHFRSFRLALIISGGEPMMDRDSIVALLNGLSAMDAVECIRIDTNAYWEPAHYKQLDPSKLILNCSFHPEQTDEQSYFARLAQIVAAGFRVGIVNFVFRTGVECRYYEYKARLRDMGIPISLNPEMHSRFADTELEFLSGELPALDYKYKALRKSPRGQACLYPAIGLEMDYAARVWNACFPHITGSFFDRELPLRPSGPVPCPSSSCYCRDKYALLKEASPERGAALNALSVYSEELLESKSREN